MHIVPENWFAFTLMALVFWGITGVTQKLSTNRISSRLSFVWFTIAMLALSGMLALTVPIAWHVKWAVFFLAVAGGTLNGLGVLTSFRALESGGKASIVISLVSLYPLLSVGFAVALLGEHLDARQAVGIAIAILAAILLSLEPAPTSA